MATRQAPADLDGPADRAPMMAAPLLPAEDKADGRSWWPWFALAALAAAFLVTAKISDPDFHWHLAMGKAMVGEGRIINEEVFSFTFPGRPFHNHEWLTQVLFFQVFDHLGAPGIQALIAGLAAMTAVLLGLTARAAGARTPMAVGLALAAVAVGLERWVPRPDAFSMALAALYLFLLTHARQRPETGRFLWLLVPGQLVWDQLHGPVYGLLFLGAALAAEAVARWKGKGPGALPRPGILLPVLAAITAAALDPYGLRQMDFFLELLRSSNGIGSVITELAPPAAFRYWPAWLALAGVVALAAKRFRHLDTAAAIVALPFLVLACRYSRMIPFAAMAMVPLAAGALASLPARAWRMGVAALFTLTVGAAIQVRGEAGQSFGIGLDDDALPFHTVRFMRDAGISGTGYHWNGWGGLIAWSFWPERRMFMFNHHAVFQAMPQLVNSGQFLDRWPLHWALVGQRAELRFFPYPDWVPVYWDDTGALLVRNEPMNAEVIRRYGLQVLMPLSNERQVLARLRDDPSLLPRLLQEIAQIEAVRPSPRWHEFAAKLHAGASPGR